jgi:hypothetical protein
MKRDQKGMGAVEGLLILVIVGLIGFVGWYVYHAKKSTDSTYNSAVSSGSSTPQASSKQNKKQVYKGIGFTLQYPSDWKFVAKGTAISGGEFASDEFLPAANYPNNNAYILMFDHDNTNLSIDQYAKTQGPADILSGQKSTINSYDAYTENYDVPGPGGVPNGYEVLVEHNGLVVIFNYTTQPGYTDTYQSIINSIKFTN